MAALVRISARERAERLQDERALAVMQLAAHGRPFHAIAADLGISENEARRLWAEVVSAIIADERPLGLPC